MTNDEKLNQNPDSRKRKQTGAKNPKLSKKVAKMVENLQQHERNRWTDEDDGKAEQSAIKLRKKIPILMGVLFTPLIEKESNMKE